MPQCKHCHSFFTRVEALKKHLQGSCPILHASTSSQPHPTEDAGAQPPPVASGATAEEEPLGHSCRVPVDGAVAPTGAVDTVTTPLFDQPDFRQMLAEGWRQVLVKPDYIARLRTHCVFCNQWVSMRGPGAKQHIRLVHADHWLRKDDANSLCSTAGLTASQPCAYCGGSLRTLARTSNTARHSFKRLLLRLSPCRTHTMEAEDQARAVALQEMTDVWGNTNPKPAEPEAAKRPPSAEKEEWPDKWRRPTTKGHHGKGDPWGSWRSWEQSASSKAEAGQPDPATAQLLRVMVKSLVRLDEDVRWFRADCNFMLFVDSVSESNTLQRLRDAVRDRLLRVGWLEDGINALLPSWHYYRWDPQTQRQVVSEREALPQDRLLRCLDVLERGCSLPTTLLRFRSTHKLGQETQAEVVPFMISISLRGCQAAECHEALTVLAYNGALKMLGLRLRPERSQQSAAIKEMTEAYLAVPFTDWTRRRKTAEEETKS